MQPLAIVLGIWCAGYALRTFTHPIFRKLGALLYLTATWFAGYYLSGGSWGGGTVAVVGWFLLPWLDILLRVRGLRLPIHKELNYRPPPSQDEFPPLREVSEAFESAGFEKVEDAGWDGVQVRQFFRIFYNPEQKMQAVINFHQQYGAGFGFLTLTSRTKDGRTFITTDNPYTNLPQPPDVCIDSVRPPGTIAHLMDEHDELLASWGVDTETELEEMDTETLPERLVQEHQQQVQHNIRTGLLADAGEGKFRYSWRGCFYLWTRSLKDLIRLA